MITTSPANDPIGPVPPAQGPQVPPPFPAPAPLQTPPAAASYNYKYKDTGVKALAGLGALALVALVIWGGVSGYRRIAGVRAPIAGVGGVNVFGPGATSTRSIATSTATTTLTTNDTDDDPTPSQPAPRSPQPPATLPPEVVFIPGSEAERISDPNGDVDLVVSIIAEGIVDSDGDFTERDEIRTSDRGAIKFEVRNAGTKESGRWEFDAELPTSPSFTYHSKSQPTLFPGDRIQYIIGFDRVKRTGEAEYSITVDPDDDIDESSESNNEVDGEIEVDN